jgi:hypothetical protein
MKAFKIINEIGSATACSCRMSCWVVEGWEFLSLKYEVCSVMQNELFSGTKILHCI